MTATPEPHVDRPFATAPAEPGGTSAGAEFARYAEAVRGKVEASLASFLEGKAESLAKLPAVVRDPIDAAFELARRGGKRWRAALVSCAYEAAGGEGGPDAVALAGVAIELLQVYLLIHDDWMDGDELRRGGPSVPAMMRSRLGPGGLADASAILAGDYAAGAALAALLSVPCRADRVLAAARELARVEEEVVLGQLLDVFGPPEWSIEATYAMKTASYTVRAPVLIGANLAGASPEVSAALEAFAAPLGVAFQLRDDLLGTFGAAVATGKARWTDLRRGKRTALLAEAARVHGAADRLRAVGDAHASGRDLEDVMTFLVESGALARVEARIEELLAEARAALDGAALSSGGRGVLASACAALGYRAH